MKNSETIILRPLLSEKVLEIQETGQKYAFQVDRGANKIDIKRAIERKFGVEVERVHTINVKGKTKRMNTRRGLTRGKRSDWKKAIVTLREGHTIEVLPGQQ